MHVQFGAVTYLGSKVLGAGTQANGLPAYRVTRHEFRLSEEDLAQNKMLRNENDALALFEVKEWSGVNTTRPEQTTVNVSYRLFDDEDGSPDNMSSRMVLNADEAQRQNALLDKAKMPAKAQIAGGPLVTVGMEQPKPLYHIERPDNSLEYLPGVKAALKEGLITNLMKQWFSVNTYAQGLNALNATLADWIEKARMG
jgi:hypothetical protein